MKITRILAAACFALVVWLPINAQAQQALVVTDCSSVPTLDTGLGKPIYQDKNGHQCVSASVSVGGFQPNGTYGSLTATASTSASTALPAASATVRITNLGAGTVSCTFATGAATGVVNNTQIGPSSSVSRVVGAFDHIACIDQTGSSGSQLVILEGGSGLGNDTGGGGGSGGGGAATIANGADTAEGSTTDSPATTPTTGSAATTIALLKALNNSVIAAPPININGTVAAWTGLTPGSAQTGTIVAPNTDQTSLGGVAYGAMANFGTSPGAVKSPNANASMFAGTSAIVADPCQTAAKVYTPINVVTGTNTIIAGVSAKKKYICSIMLFSAGTDNVAIFQATTGTSCVTALVGVIGGTTTATGMQMTAQTGFALGNGASAVAATTVVNTDLCVVTSASVQMSGVVVTVDQ